MIADCKSRHLHLLSLHLPQGIASLAAPLVAWSHFCSTYDASMYCVSAVRAAATISLKYSHAQATPQQTGNGSAAFPGSMDLQAMCISADREEDTVLFRIYAIYPGKPWALWLITRRA